MRVLIQIVALQSPAVKGYRVCRITRRCRWGTEEKWLMAAWTKEAIIASRCMSEIAHLSRSGD
jgi:hypothetical protein